MKIFKIMAIIVASIMSTVPAQAGPEDRFFGLYQTAPPTQAMGSVEVQLSNYNAVFLDEVSQALDTPPSLAWTYSVAHREGRPDLAIALDHLTGLVIRLPVAVGCSDTPSVCHRFRLDSQGLIVQQYGQNVCFVLDRDPVWSDEDGFQWWVLSDKKFCPLTQRQSRHDQKVQRARTNLAGPFLLFKHKMA